MNLLIDIGNTRTKWALAANDGILKEVSVCLNQDVANNNIAELAKNATKILVANVAGDKMTQQLFQQLIEVKAPIVFVKANASICGIENGYVEAERLGVDRWLALLACFKMRHKSCLVVNAGTAITIDALEVFNSKQAKFLGGTIMPGLHLMRESLNANTAQLAYIAGELKDFPTHTQDAIYSGCMNAAIGGIQLQWQKLYDTINAPPTIFLSGGDLEKIYQYLPQDLVKHTIIVDNLVLHGLMHLERETA